LKITHHFVNENYVKYSHKEFFRVKNFKSLKDVEIELKPITLLFGSNGSGKSSLLKAIKFLRSNIESFSNNEEVKFSLDEHTNLGSYSDTVTNGNLSNRISMEIEIISDKFIERHKNNPDLNYQWIDDLIVDRNSKVLTKTNIPTFGKTFSGLEDYTNVDNHDDEVFEFRSTIFNDDEEPRADDDEPYNFPPSGMNGRGRDMELMVTPFYLFPFKFKIEFSYIDEKAVVDLLRIYNSFDKSFIEFYPSVLIDDYYIKKTVSIFNDIELDEEFNLFYDHLNHFPFRNNDLVEYYKIIRIFFYDVLQRKSFWKKKSYKQKREIFQRAIRWYYYMYQYVPDTINSILSNYHLPTIRELPKEYYQLKDNNFLETDYYGILKHWANKPAYDKQTRIVNKYLREFALADSLRVKKDSLVGYMEFKPIGAKKYIHLRAASSGLLQVLPVLFKISEASNLLIEQPELHLHPRLQSLLAKFFTESKALWGNNDFGHFIIETHSEHLIRKFQVLLANSKIEKHDIGVYFFYSSKNSRLTKIIKLELEDSGFFISPWPDGFFDDSYNLTKELLKANRN